MNKQPNKTNDPQTSKKRDIDYVKLCNLLSKKNDLELVISNAKSDLFNVESQIFNELLRTQSFDCLNINYKRLKSSLK